jgi:hypothetical protein
MPPSGTGAASAWEEIALPAEISPPIGTVIFDHQGQIYAGASGGVVSPGFFFSPGDGQEQVWQGGGLPGFFFSPGDGQEWVWQGGEGEVVWAASYSGTPPDLLYVDAQQPQIVIAARIYGYGPNDDIGNPIDGRGWSMYKYLRSTDGGRSWRTVRAEEGIYPAFVTDPRQAGVYYLAGGGVQRSANYGETWESRSAGLPSGQDIAGLTLEAHSEAAVLYASIAWSDSLWRSRDEGLHWEYAGRLGEGENIVGLATNPLAADQLYAVTDHGGAYVSGDQGQRWTRLLPGESEWATGWSWLFDRKMRLRFDPVDPERFFVIAGPRLLETRDGGQHWRSLGDDLASVPRFNDVGVDPLAPHLLYAATPRGLYRLDTSSVITAVEQAGPVPQHFALHQNYPNPFNPTTTIRFSLAQPGGAELSIYDLLGQRVAVLVQGMQEAGPQVRQWDGRDEQGRELASGVYLCRLQAGGQVETRRLLLLR